MAEYAIIETGGKQYRVHNNEIVCVERLGAEAGQQVEFDHVLAVSNGQRLLIGTPRLHGATITATVMEHYRDRKLVSFKFKRRKGYRKKKGHRQELTRVKIHTFLTEEADKPVTERQPGDSQHGT